MRIRALAAAAAILIPLPALAQQEPAFIEGVHLGSEEMCVAARANGLASTLEQGGLALTAAGLHGYEYHCDFLQVLRGVRTPGWVVTALCEEPGMTFADVIAVMPRGEGRLELTSMALDSAADAEAGIDGIDAYVFCEGVALP